MSVGPFQILIILLVLLLLFGRGRIGDTLGDVGRGVKAFRRGLDDRGEPPALPVDGQGSEVALGEVIPNPADK